MGDVRVVLPGTMDRKLKGGKLYRGEVVGFSDKEERLAYVYGNTLEEMRARKRLVFQALQVLEKRNQEGASDE